MPDRDGNGKSKPRSNARRPAGRCRPAARRALAEAEARRAASTPADRPAELVRPQGASSPFAMATGRSRASPRTSEPGPRSAQPVLDPFPDAVTGIDEAERLAAQRRAPGSAAADAANGRRHVDIARIRGADRPRDVAAGERRGEDARAVIAEAEIDRRIVGHAADRRRQLQSTGRRGRARNTRSRRPSRAGTIRRCAAPSRRASPAAAPACRRHRPARRT